MTREEFPHRRAGSYALVAYGVFVFLFLAAGWKPDPRAWGLHSLAFLTPFHLVAAALLLGAVFAAPIARMFAATVTQLGARVVGSLWAPLVVAAAALVFFIFNRIEFHFLGDGRTLALSTGVRQRSR